MSRIWTESEISSLIESNDAMVIRSVKKLYEYQTNDEKVAEHTKHLNGVGFNPFIYYLFSYTCKKTSIKSSLSKNQLKNNEEKTQEVHKTTNKDCQRGGMICKKRSHYSIN